MVGRNARLRLRFRPSAAYLGALASHVRFSRLEVSEQSSRLKILVRMARRGALMRPCVQRCSIGGLYAHANGGAFPRGDAPACCRCARPPAVAIPLAVSESHAVGCDREWEREKRNVKPRSATTSADAGGRGLGSANRAFGGTTRLARRHARLSGSAAEASSDVHCRQIASM
jgi:hypothetical protein